MKKADIHSTSSICLLALLAIALIPILYGVPLLQIGLFDPHALRHLDEGEFTIFRAWKDVYARGPFYWGPFDPMHVYPKAFYNLAGLFLYPYSALRGSDLRVILTTWRGLDLSFSVASIVLLYLLIRKVFQSRGAALIAAALLATTPEFLVWATNVRPNPPEIFFTYGALYFLIRLLERFSYRDFLLGVFAGSLAFASKYGGTLFLILFPLATLYRIRREPPDALALMVDRQSRILSRLFPLLTVFLGALGVGFIWLLLKNHGDGTALFLEVSQSTFPHELLPKVVRRLSEWRSFIQIFAWGSGTLLMGLVLFLTLYRKSILHQGTSPSILFGCFILQSLLIYGVVFFVSGPAYLTHPGHFLSEFGYMVYYLALGGSYNSERLPGFLESLRLTGGEVPGAALLLPLLAFGLFFIYRRLRSTPHRGPLVFILLYAALALFQFFSMPIPQVRHILPVVGLLYGVGGFALVELFQKWRVARLQRVLAVALATLGIGYLQTSVSHSVERWTNRHTAAADIGFTVGGWIRQHYHPETRILTNQWTFYTPPEFSHVETTTFTEWEGETREEKNRLVAELILQKKPEIVIVTYSKVDPNAVDLERLLTEETALSQMEFRHIKDFESARRGDRIHRVAIYERNRAIAHSG